MTFSPFPELDERPPVDGPTGGSQGAPADLFEPVPGDQAAHGRFDRVARTGSWEMFTDRHRGAAFAGVAAAVVGLHLLAKRLML